jgi:hypothetical protein
MQLDLPGMARVGASEASMKGEVVVMVQVSVFGRVFPHL